jgi:tetratricopeptide (TPR) repeat protein
MRISLKLGAFALLLAVFQLRPVNEIAYGTDQRGAAARHADKGLQLAQGGDLVQAESELRRAVQLAPGNARFLASLGTVLAMAGKLEESTTILERALRIDPSDSTSRRYLAANLWQLHRYVQARQNLEKILKETPDDRPSRLLLGMVSENMKDYATAVKMLSSVPAEVRERPQSIAALARSYYRTGATENARSTLQELLTHAAGTAGILLGGQIADEAGDYTAAEMLLDSIKADPADQPTLGYRLALIQYHAHRFEESQRTLVTLTTAGYKSSDILNLLGWCYAKQNQTQEAVRALEEAIRLAPGQESNYVDLGKILVAQHLLPGALDIAKRATSAFPNSPNAFSLRGSIEMRMSQFTDARASYGRAVKLNPGDPDVHLGLAQAQFGAGSNQEANASFEAAIQRFPRNSNLRVQYALILLKEAETGDTPAEARAEQFLQSALTLDRSLPEAHYQLGNLALRRGRPTEALHHLEEAARLDPNVAGVHFALSRAYRRLGKSETAAREMDLYQELKDAAGTETQPRPPN